MTRRGRLALKSGVWAGCLAPLASLLVWAWHGDLTANPISFATNWLGDWALRIFLVSLALTPLRLVTGMAWQMPLRRLLGLFAFFYASLHVLVWLALDHFFDWRQMGTDIAKRPYITVGMAALLCLIPLTATSTAGMIKRLGAPAWRRLHRLAYAAGVLACVHFLWLAKVGRVEQYVYAAALGLLLGVRLWYAARRLAGRGGLASRARNAVTRGGTALVLALVLGACATAGAPPAAAPSPAPVRRVLVNGVTIIAEEHRTSEVVALQLWLRVGARVESAHELGMSHYIEHMIFKGTPTRPVGSIDRLVEGLGGTSNAYTAHDDVHYDVVLPARALRAGIELLADIGVNASFPPDEIAAEKKVVFEEMSALDDDPNRLLLERLSQVGYEPHPYGRPVLGTRAVIEGLTREQLLAYYRRYYVPRNMVLVVVGAANPGEVLALAEASFGRLRGGEGEAPPLPPVPALGPSRRVDVARAERQAYLGLAWRAPAVADADVFAVDLLTYILGDSASSRLNQALRERQGLVDSIEARYGALRFSGLTTVTARLDPANLERAETAVLEVLRRVRDEGVSDAELRRAIISAESLYAFDNEPAEGRARTYGLAEVTSSLAAELHYLSRLRQVTTAQVQAAARAYFGEGDYARVRLVPRAAAR